LNCPSFSCRTACRRRLHWLILLPMNLCDGARHSSTIACFNCFTFSNSLPWYKTPHPTPNGIIHWAVGWPHVKGDILTRPTHDGVLSRVRRRAVLLQSPPWCRHLANNINFYSSQAVCLNWYQIYQKSLNFTYAFKCYHQKCQLAPL